MITDIQWLIRCPVKAGKTRECLAPKGFTLQEGYIPGEEMEKLDLTLYQCAEECQKDADCKSFQIFKEEKCILLHEYHPTESENHDDYQFFSKYKDTKYTTLRENWNCKAPDETLSSGETLSQCAVRVDQ